MDPVVAPLVAALAAGAAAGLKDDAAQAVRDAYSRIKSFLGRKYPTVDMHPIETKPASSAKQASLAEDLVDSGADRDPELLALVEALKAMVPAPTVRQIVQVQEISVQDHGTANAPMIAGDQYNEPRGS